MVSLSKKPIGIEVTDNAIKAFQLEKKGRRAKILKSNQIKLAPGIVERGRIKNKEKLTKAFKELFSKAKPSPITEKKIVFGFPESQLYIHNFELQPHKKRDRNSLVLKEAEASISLSRNELLFSYKIANKKKEKGKEKIEILLTATNKATVLEWQKFFKELKLEVIAFDVEPLAIFRTLFPKKIKTPICTIDVGAAATNIAIFNKTGLCYSHTINTGGNDFTEAIAKKLGVEFNQAEEEKLKVGLSDKKSNVFTALDKTLEPMIGEIKELFDYLEKTTKQRVGKIVLLGGSGKLKNINEYFNDNFDLTVKKATLNFSKKEVPLEYIESAGLALRGMSKQWIKDISIPTKDHFLDEINNEGVWGQLAGGSMTDFCLPSFTSRTQAKKMRSEKLTLIIVLFIGVLCIFGAYSYRNRQKAKKEQELKSRIGLYMNTQSFDFKIPVAVSSSEYEAERAKGRIIANVVQSAKDYNSAILASEAIVKEELEKGEELSPEPIDKLTDQDTIIFPLTINWLAYSKEGANRLFLEEMDKANKENIDYTLDKIEKKGIEATQNSNLYYITGIITISSSELIKVEK